MDISVITPFYEGNSYINNYLKMMIENMNNLGDKYSAEVILVNDSPWCKIEGDLSFPWLRIINNEKNCGIHKSRINGIEAASGDYIIMLDQDDLLVKDALRKYLDYIFEKENPNRDAKNTVFVSNAKLEQKDSFEIWYRTDYHKSLIGDLETYLQVGTQIISPGQCLIPKNLIPNYWKNNICKKNGADDYFLWLLMLESGVDFKLFDEVLYVHVYTANNISADTSVTDESCYEFIEFLLADMDFSKEHVKELERMLKFKAAFRNAGKFGKIKLAFKYKDLMKINLEFKKKTKTKYGFNR